MTSIFVVGSERVKPIKFYGIGNLQHCSHNHRIVLSHRANYLANKGIVTLQKFPVNNYLFKVSKIKLEQRPPGRCSNFILLTLNR